MNKNITALIFDMDGVLCDSEKAIAQAACRMFKEAHGVQAVPEDFVPFVGTGEDRYLGGVAKKYRVTLSMPRDKDTTYQLYADMVQDSLQPIPGVLDFIKTAGRKYKLAVATSADPFKMSVNLSAIHLTPSTFSALITGNDITHKKPDPEIFLTAARRLDCAPGQCVVFEDALHGVEAAKRAGMYCIGIASSFPAAQLTEAGADEVWPDFSEAHLHDILTDMASA